MKTQWQRRIVFCTNVLAVGAVFLLAGCSKRSSSPDEAANEESQEEAEDGATMGDKDATPEQLPYLAAARPFALALAGGKYEEAFALLSPLATARMSLNQFAPEDNEAKFEQNEKKPLTGVTVEKFCELMKLAEARFGAPQALKEFSLFSTDPKAMDRKGKASLDALDAMLAVGMMPDSVPAAIRRASVRGQIRTMLSAQEMEKVASAQETTVEELQKDPDFIPYFTVKVVVIEEDGQLRVGYFELLPPSMMD